MQYRREEETIHERQTLKYFITAPFIYAIFIPVFLLHILIELYHRICFPVYGIPLVNAKDFIIIDRQKLEYLLWYEKANCAYCGYVNGVLRYSAQIAAESEKYWCGIMHEKYGGSMPEHHKDFLPYGSEDDYKKYVAKDDIHSESQNHHQK